MTVAFGCGKRVVTTPVHRDALLEIRLAKNLDSAGHPIEKNYGHPVPLDPGSLTEIFSALQVRRSVSPLARALNRLFSDEERDVEPAFGPEESARLAMGLNKALSRADSTERAEFRFRHRRGLFDAGVTTGVVYLRDDRLAVILGDYRRRALSGTEESYSAFPDPLDSRGESSFQFVSGPFQEPLSTDRKDLEGHGVVIDYRGLLAAASASGSAGPAESGGSTDAEERLRKLKQLHDEGLISDEDYQNKKDEILVGL